jgi:hypothetical protein
MIKINQSMVIQGVTIQVITRDDEDYISLTDMSQKFSGAEQRVKNWLRNKNTVDFLAVWERVYNPSFNWVELHQIKKEEELDRLVMSAKVWTERTGGIGLIAKAGRNGGTFAHKDIAFEFGSWLSPEFKLYLIKEFQRLKEREAHSGQLEWNIKRSLTKVHYKIHTDAVKTHLIPPEVSAKYAGHIYALEADVLNIALFGKSAREWRAENPNKGGSQREYATVEQLIVLSILESQNALLIQMEMPASERVILLNGLARTHMRSLINNPSIRKIESKHVCLT